MGVEINHRSASEVRFAEVFTHLGLLSAYARRRGARSRRDRRNLVLADRRRHGTPALQDLDEVDPAAPPKLPNPSLELDRGCRPALR
jgi:hypothetical protein